MSYPLINAAAINAQESGHSAIPGLALCHAGTAQAQLEFEAQGSSPWGFGELRAKMGEDVELYLPGISLVQSDWHSAETQQPGANTAFSAQGSRVLAFGEWVAVAGGLEADAEGCVALGVGETAAERVAFAAGAAALGAGEVGATIVGRAESATALALGGLAVVQVVQVPGVALGRAGVANIQITGRAGEVEGCGAWAFGDLAVLHAFHVRQHLALGMGPVRAQKEGAC